MDHPTRQQLSQLNLGLLNPEQSETIAEHVDACLTCREALVTIGASERDSLIDGIQAPHDDSFGGEPERANALLAARQLASGEAETTSTKTDVVPLNAEGDADISGRVIGEYVILGEIGAGGMGQVYKARHQRMKRIVALKVLPSSAMKTPEAVKRFRREVEAAARLMHPNIVVAHDAGESGDIHYLVMEYVEGSDLSMIVKRDGPLPFAKAVDYCLQTARGLAYAHARGIVHRDIKPSNLLLDKHGVIKILDMGLARLESEAIDLDAIRDEELTHSGQVMGTADYMAPEQALDTRQADAKADVYSLGCTLYRLLTGRSPYTGSTLMARMLAHRDDPIPSAIALRPDLPRRLDDLLRRMLAKRPSARPSVDDVISELTALTTQASGGGGKRPPSRIAVAAAGAAAFFAMLGVWVIVRDKHGEEVGRMKVPDQGSVVVQDGATTKPTDPDDEAFEARASAVGLDRAVAEWAQSLGAFTKVKFDQGTNRYAPTVRLPNFDIKLVGIEFAANRPPAMAHLARLSRLKELEELSLYSAPTTDDGLKSICQIAGLRKLFMAWVGFSAKGWNHLPNLKALESLSLNHVQLGDVEMKAISQTTSLQYLDLYDCQIKGAGAEHLAGMPNLRHFTTEEGVNDASLAKLLKTTKLDLLGLLYTRDVSAAGLLPIREAATIKYLSIGGPSFSSSHYKSLGQLEQIETLDLWMVPLNDDDLQSLVGMKALQRLKLRQTRVTSAGVAAFRKARPKVNVEWTSLGTQSATTSAVQTGSVAGRSSVVAPFDSVQAKAQQAACARDLRVPGEFINSVGMSLKLLPAGEFEMGSTDADVAAALKIADQLSVDPQTRASIERSERFLHHIAVTRPFYLGAHEVTVGQFRTFVEATGYKTEAERPAGGRTWRAPGYEVSDDMPVTAVSWNDATAYCEFLSKREGHTYRLPTEAEWEFACRSGTDTHYSFGDDYRIAEQFGWFQGNGENAAHAVGLKPANAFGIHDMHGNAQEWCRDVFDDTYYSKSPLSDPTGPTAGARRALRGGSWLSTGGPVAARSAFRFGAIPTSFGADTGFRCVREVTADTTSSATVSVSPTLFADDAKAAPTDRAVAEWVLSVRGEVTVQAGDVTARILPGMTLPSKDLKIIKVVISNTWAPTDRELSRLVTLTELKKLHLSRSPLSEKGMATFSQLPKLDTLGLAHMNVSESELSVVTGLKLKWLSLSDVEADAETLKSVLKMQSLENLDLYNTPVTPALIKGVCKLPNLATLVLGQGVTDECLSDIAQAPKLYGLILYNLGQVTPQGLSRLADSKSLTEIGLWGRGMTDAHVAVLAQMPRLTKIDIWSAPITDAGLQSLSGLKNLRQLSIQSGTKTTAEGLSRLQQELPKLTILKGLGLVW